MNGAVAPSGIWTWDLGPGKWGFSSRGILLLSHFLQRDLARSCFNYTELRLLRERPRSQMPTGTQPQDCPARIQGAQLIRPPHTLNSFARTFSSSSQFLQRDLARPRSRPNFCNGILPRWDLAPLGSCSRPNFYNGILPVPVLTIQS